MKLKLLAEMSVVNIIMEGSASPKVGQPKHCLPHEVMQQEDLLLKKLILILIKYLELLLVYRKYEG